MVNGAVLVYMFPGQGSACLLGGHLGGSSCLAGRRAAASLAVVCCVCCKGLAELGHPASSCQTSRAVCLQDTSLVWHGHVHPLDPHAARAAQYAWLALLLAGRLPSICVGTSNLHRGVEQWPRPSGPLE